MVCIDIGNTAIKGWKCEIADKSCEKPAPVAIFSCETNLPDKEICAILSQNLQSQEHLRYVSVVPTKNILLESVCEKNHLFCEQYDPASDTRIAYDYAAPGHDRIAAAAGAASAYDLSDFIVVDAGTAVKIDLVTNRVFRGGVILPGPGLSLRALAANTAQLPEITPEMSAPPGTDTVSCMRSGVTYGICYAIDGFIASYRDNYGMLPCIVTGGFGELYYRFSANRAAPPLFDPALIARSLITYHPVSRQ